MVIDRTKFEVYVEIDFFCLLPEFFTLLVC